MKKILIIIAFIIIIYPFKVDGVVTNATDTSKIRINYFYDDNEESLNGRNWLDSYLENKNDVTKEYISIKDNKELYNKVKSILKIKKDNVPLIVIGSNYLIGFTEKTKSKITKVLEAYQDSDKQCNLISKIRNNKDIDECLEINSNIYKEDNHIITYLLIILILIITILIILKIVVKRKK